MAKKKKTRASNGMGSIRQRSDGRWEARYTTPDGRQRSVYGKSEKEVTAKLRSALHDLDSGAWREPSKMTVAEWVEIWLRDYQTHTATSSRRTYRNFVRLHIVPAIGSLRLSKVLPLHVRRVISNMTEKGLAPASIKECKNVMSCSFNAAIEAGLIKTNPASNVKTPRIVKKPFCIVDRDSYTPFLQACRRQRIGLAIIFLLQTGLRASEERGLRWDDIDFDKSTMHIQRQLPASGERKFTQPKDGSTRLIQLTPESVALLKEQHRQQAEQRLRAGAAWKTDDICDGLVFRSDNGNAIFGSVLYNAVRAVGAEIGMPELHPHDLRHSYAVAALRSGVDVKTVQHNLGHRNAAMTLDVYAAYTTDAGKVGAERLSEYWKNAIK